MASYHGYRHINLHPTGEDSLLDFSCFEDIYRPNSGKQSTINARQLQIQLQQTQQLSDWYREQCIKQEEELSRAKEEGERCHATPRHVIVTMTHRSV